MEELVPGKIYVETGFRKVTVGAIVTDEGIICIDTPPYPEEAKAWRARLESLDAGPILYIINTDYHRDRILGNCWFDAPVVAHQAVYDAVSNLPSSFLDNAIEMLSEDEDERASFENVRLVPPSVSYTRRLMIKRGGWTVTLMAMPGPTPGNTWLHFPEYDLVFTGDSVVSGTHPIMTNAVSKEWLNSLNILRRARFKASRVVPGRGPVVGKEASYPVSEYIRLARRRVQALYRAGRPRADTSSLIAEFLPMFPVPPGQEENIQRLIKSGLDRIYEECKAEAAQKES